MVVRWKEAQSARIMELGKRSQVQHRAGPTLSASATFVARNGTPDQHFLQNICTFIAHVGNSVLLVGLKQACVGEGDARSQSALACGNSRVTYTPCPRTRPASTP